VVQTSRTNGLGRSSNASRLSGRGGGVTACPGVLAGASGPRPPWAAPLPAVCRLNLADDRRVFLSRITCLSSASLSLASRGCFNLTRLLEVAKLARQALRVSLLLLRTALRLADAVSRRSPKSGLRRHVTADSRSLVPLVPPSRRIIGWTLEPPPPALTR